MLIPMKLAESIGGSSPFDQAAYLRSISVLLPHSLPPTTFIFHHKSKPVLTQHYGDCDSNSQPRWSCTPLPLPRIQRCRTWALARDPQRPGLLHSARDANHNRQRLERKGIHGGNRWVRSHLNPSPLQQPQFHTPLATSLT